MEEKRGVEDIELYEVAFDRWHRFFRLALKTNQT